MPRRRSPPSRRSTKAGCSFLLESAEHIDHGGRYSFVGSNPRVVFKSRGRTVTVTEAGVTREFETAGDPLAELQKLMARYIPVPLAHLPRFAGGAVGYLGYDMVRFFEPTIGDAAAGRPATARVALHGRRDAADL